MSNRKTSIELPKDALSSRITTIRQNAVKHTLPTSADKALLQMTKQCERTKQLYESGHLK